MQGTADFHHEITPARFDHAAGLLEDATAFDTAIHMLPTLRQFLIRRLLLVGQCFAPWFAGNG